MTSAACGPATLWPSRSASTAATATATGTPTSTTRSGSFTSTRRASSCPSSPSTRRTRSTTFKEIAAEPLPQRVSTMLYFKYMTAPRRTRVHAPPQHRAVLEGLYKALAAPADFGVPAEPTGQGRVTATLDRSWGYGEIHVQVAGADTAA